MQLSSPTSLDESSRHAVRALADEVEASDGAPPLSDGALAGLTSDSVKHVLAVDSGEVVGYAQLDGESLELVGNLDALGPLLDEIGTTSVKVWAHGARTRLVPALSQRSFTATRTLLQLRRPIGSIEPRRVPDGVRVTPFVVGRDEDAWVRVNAAAFVHHPEQGTWTRADVEARESESWFEAEGFLLAWRGDELLGFHWTKRHTPTLGEVYVLGVDPSGQGLGLGGALLDAGLAHLTEVGCTDVLLYVEADNDVARGLYERTGFTEYDRDTQFSA